jgi:hypothetical protein
MCCLNIISSSYIVVLVVFVKDVVLVIYRIPTRLRQRVGLEMIDRHEDKEVT